MAIFPNYINHIRKNRSQINNFKEEHEIDKEREFFELLMKSAPKIDNRREIYKEILEVLQMPITNPKTGEEDYVDASKVKDIIIDSTTLYNIESQDPLKITYYLEGRTGNTDEGVDLISYAGTKKKDTNATTFSLHHFEEMISEAVYSENEKRLEDVDSFKEAMEKQADQFIASRSKNGDYFVHKDVMHFKREGIGLVIDKRTDKEVATFEYMDFSTNGAQARGSVEYFTGLVSEDVHHYKFVFYSLEDHIIYNMIPAGADPHFAEIRNGQKIMFNAVDINIEVLKENTERHQMALKAQEAKINLAEINLNDQLNKMQYDDYHASRMSILEESRQQAKKEKIVNQFADIDMDL